MKKLKVALCASVIANIVLLVLLLGYLSIDPTEEQRKELESIAGYSNASWRKIEETSYELFFPNLGNDKVPSTDYKGEEFSENSSLITYTLSDVDDTSITSACGVIVNETSSIDDLWYTSMDTCESLVNMSLRDLEAIVGAEPSSSTVKYENVILDDNSKAIKVSGKSKLTFLPIVTTQEISETRPSRDIEYSGYIMLLDNKYIAYIWGVNADIDSIIGTLHN